MAHRHAFTTTGIIFALLGGAAGCLGGSGGDDVGPAFTAGAARKTSNGAGSYGTGHGGASGSGQAGAGVAGSGTTTGACTVGATGMFTFAWSIEDGTGAASSCAAVTAQTVDIDAVNLTTGAEAVMTVPCAALAATSCAMAAGDYALSLKLRNATGMALAEIAAPTLTLVSGQATAVASLPFHVGGADATASRGIALTWSIEQADTMAAQTCATAGGMTVRVVVGAAHFDMPCTDGKGRTATLAPGAYPVTLRLLDAQGADLSVTQTMTITVGAGQLVFLGDVLFDIL